MYYKSKPTTHGKALAAVQDVRAMATRHFWTLSDDEFRWAGEEASALQRAPLPPALTKPVVVPKAARVGVK